MSNCIPSVQEGGSGVIVGMIVGDGDKVGASVSCNDEAVLSSNNDAHQHMRSCSCYGFDDTSRHFFFCCTS